MAPWLPSGRIRAHEHERGGFSAGASGRINQRWVKVGVPKRLKISGTTEPLKFAMIVDKVLLIGAGLKGEISSNLNQEMHTQAEGQKY